MFAIVRVGGKQFRAEEGVEIVVDRLDADEGESVELDPIIVSGSNGVQFSGEGQEATKVERKVLEHFRGPKIEVLKFNPSPGTKGRPVTVVRSRVLRWRR